ncbi:DUF1173 family protein [Pseudomonas protegens]|uniref:DUF1173 family protein n=1 Tax=Pseudomonas protegens TaxID=380021 RepID=UPI0023EACDAB|nr:DUF1173 family protein [Pseudomonas protegens]MDF4211134.1 DUF1173 family protein [Pseudomonas protegens]
MSEKQYPVRITLMTSEKDYSVEFQTSPDRAKLWKDVLQSAHSKAVVTCLCDGPGDRRLAIRHLSSNDTFHLSRYPRTGPEHALMCLFFSPDHNKSGLGAYNTGVVEETIAGDLKIRLQLGLRKRDTKEGEEQEPEAEGKTESKPAAKAGESKTAMTLLGLLHLLWSEANLNTWTPAMTGKRNLGLVHHLLMNTASKVLTSRLRLAEALVVATSNSSGKQPDANAAKVGKAIKNGRRLIVIAPLAAYTPEREECSNNYLTITGFHGVPRIMVEAEEWASVKRRFVREIAAWSRGYRVVAIVQTDKPISRSKANALDIALMVVSNEWIPVESSYEAAIESKLRTESRRFTKPLRFDSTEEVVFPDFWLTDVNSAQEYPMEVYGRADAKYLARKQIKSDHYTTTYGSSGWWWWDAAADPRGQSIPEFPPARVR